MEETTAHGFIDYLTQKLKLLKPESHLPGKLYLFGNRYEAKTVEMGIRGLEQDPEIFTALQQGRLDQVQEHLNIGKQRTKTLYRYCTSYSAKGTI